MFPKISRHPQLRLAYEQCRPALIWAAAFSALINILYLTPTIYMLQIYDRVVPAASGGTLLLISLVAIAGLATLCALDWVRARMLVRISARLERQLAGRTLEASLSRRDLTRVERAEAIREFDTLRQTVAGAMTLAIFDAPWTPIYLLAAFLIHPFLGLTTLGAVLVLLTLGYLNERSTHVLLDEANESAAVAYGKQAQISAYAEEIRAIGLRAALVRKLLHERGSANGRQLEASFVAGNYGALIKFFRLVFQSLALAVGAWLAITGRISAGSIIAASLLLGRTLAPIEQVVGSWKSFARVRQSQHKLELLLDKAPAAVPIALPALRGQIDVEGLVVHAAGTDRAVLHNISFGIRPGESVGVAGLSGAGKSTLLRALAGSLTPAAGIIRYDGADQNQWDMEKLALAIGYLPQDCVLFPGTVRENISRFAAWRGGDAEDVDAQVIAAANAIGAHDMILRLPNGYDTPVGNGGIGLSAGQTQRVAIARAMFGAPRLIIMDEPNAHLDAEACAALLTTLAKLKEEGVTIILSAHSAEFLAACDRFLIVAGGRIAERTRKTEVPSIAQAKRA